MNVKFINAKQAKETCQWEISASSWFYYNKFIAIYGHMNVREREIPVSD